MKAFISWSGDLSGEVAMALRDWLPDMFPGFEPFFSEQDIDKGTRWGDEIAGRLEEMSAGIICVTRENLSRPWLNFEAGALAKAREGIHVVPFLVDITRSDVTGPLAQFQSTIFTEADVWKMVLSFNTAHDGENTDPQRLRRRFDKWWPDLEQTVTGVIVMHASSQPELLAKPQRDTYDILEEILELAREQRRGDARVPFILDYLDVRDFTTMGDAYRSISRLLKNREQLTESDLTVLHRLQSVLRKTMRCGGDALAVQRGEPLGRNFAAHTAAGLSLEPVRYSHTNPDLDQSPSNDVSHDVMRDDPVDDV